MMWIKKGGRFQRIKINNQRICLLNCKVLAGTPEVFFNSVLALTENSLNNAKEVLTEDIALAGLKVRLTFAGRSLQTVILPALKHLLFSELQTDIDYTIYLWDSLSTNTTYPHSPAGLNDFKLRGEIEGLNDKRFQAGFFGHAKMLNLLDRERKLGIVCFRSSLDIPSFEIACPLRGVFSWILNSNNRILIHAAAVGVSDSAVIVGGLSGSGKSSTTIKCLLAGFNYLGDDLCAVSYMDDVPKVYSVYSSGKSVRNGRIKFEELKKMKLWQEDDDYDKELYFFSDYFQEQLPLEKELKAILIPKQGNSEIGIEFVTKTSVLSVITSSTIQLLPNAGNEILYVLKSIISKVPCYQLNLGNDIDKIPEMIKKLINSIGHN